MSATLVEQRRIRRPRQPPDRIVDRLADPREVGGEAVVLGVEGRQIGTEGDAGSAREGREIDEQLRLLLVGERQGVGQDQAPLRVRVADLDGQPRDSWTSPGRNEAPEIMFSTAGTRTRRRGSAAMIISARASAAAHRPCPFSSAAWPRPA